MRTIPPEYLALTLRDLLAFHLQPTDTDVATETIANAVEHFAQRIATQDRASAEADRAWLTEQIDGLPTRDDVIDHEAERIAAAGTS